MNGNRTAVVIGGGIAGLATAALLAREGYDTTIVEARDELGGRAGNWEHAGFRFDTGPSWYLMPEVFDHFYRLLGTSADEQLTLSRLDAGLFTGTRWEGNLTLLEMQWGRTIGQMPSPYTAGNPLIVPYQFDQGP